MIAISNMEGGPIIEHNRGMPHFYLLMMLEWVGGVWNVRNKGNLVHRGFHIQHNGQVRRVPWVQVEVDNGQQRSSQDFIGGLHNQNVSVNVIGAGNGGRLHYMQKDGQLVV